MKRTLPYHRNNLQRVSVLITSVIFMAATFSQKRRFLAHRISYVLKFYLDWCGNLDTKRRRRGSIITPEEESHQEQRKIEGKAEKEGNENRRRIKRKGEKWLEEQEKARLVQGGETAAGLPSFQHLCGSSDSTLYVVVFIISKRYI